MSYAYSPNNCLFVGMFFKASDSWKAVRDGQSMTRDKCVQTLTSGLARINTVRLPDSGPRDPLKRCLETVGNMTACRSQ